MTRPWKTLATVPAAEGPLELRQRGDDFLIVIGGRVLMNSFARHSEEELARLGIAAIPGRPNPTILVSGLGMGFTLRAALDAAPAGARIIVVEIDPQIVEWCKGPLGRATSHALDDPRVELVVEDVAAVIKQRQPGKLDAILLDLYEGPNAASQRRDDPFYSPAALERSRMALSRGGVLGVWAEDADLPFAKRFATAGFDVTTHAIGRGGRKHIVYLGRRRER